VRDVLVRRPPAIYLFVLAVRDQRCGPIDAFHAQLQAGHQSWVGDASFSHR